MLVPTRQSLLCRLGLLVIAGGALAVTIGMPGGAISGPDAAVVLVCCWLVRILSAGLVVAVAFGVAAAAFGPASRAAAVARHTCPTWLRQLAAGAVSGSTAALIAAPGAAAAVVVVHQGAHGGRLPAGVTAPPLPPLGWPGLNRPRAPEVAPPLGPVTTSPTATQQAHPEPTPIPTATATSTPAPIPPTAGPTATRSPARQSAPRPEGPHLGRPTPGGGHVVVVRPGETLWSIAAAALPPPAPAAKIAASWPRWWRANRSVIGADPNLLLPGERLCPPSLEETR